MKTVLSMDGSKKYLYPYKVYCKTDLKETLECMLQRNNFKEMLHNGPRKSTDNSTMSNICDGELYKSFADKNRIPFF